ncbi:hypothetical protein V1L54_04330 [Streptomyces sp. TRM 70361]|uniref:Uncharacterized protein n=1 Tax=Streptomyces carminius TaxID=2665496 RepID=A0A2M8LVD1_9ACTN|nr:MULTISPECIES: hypothetical protein [Streptomyces]MEE1938644.1 hypothetical protein [Streptomyces sp. TRM 70361]PJE95906.1 hypothetical protein CUT44_19000 [Streptomyces carminius]
MSTLNKYKGFRKSRPGLYLAIGSSLFGVVGIVKQVQLARRETDRLKLLDAVVSGAAVLTNAAILVRELRRLDIDDVLADD